MYTHSKIVPDGDGGDLEITVAYLPDGLRMSSTQHPSGEEKSILWTPQEGYAIQRMMILANGSSQDLYK